MTLQPPPWNEELQATASLLAAEKYSPDAAAPTLVSELVRTTVPAGQAEATRTTPTTNPATTLQNSEVPSKRRPWRVRAEVRLTGDRSVEGFTPIPQNQSRILEISAFLQGASTFF